MCRGCWGEHRSPAETLRPGQTSGSMTSINPYIAGADSISARELCRCRTRARASTARPYNAPVLHLLKECIRVGRVELLVCPHQGDEVLGLAQIDDVVGVPRQHVDGLGLVAGHLKFQHLAAADAALLNQTVARNHDEKLPLRVVPVLTLCDAGLRDVDAELAAALGFEQLGKAAAGVLVLFQVKDDLLFGQIGQIRRVQLFCKAARRNLRQYAALRAEP